MFTRIKTTKAGNTQPKLWALSGMNLTIDFKVSEGHTKPTISGMLNTKVTKTTYRNTIAEANRSGIEFNRIKTIVMG